MVAIWGEALRHDCINAELKVRRKESCDVNWKHVGNTPEDTTPRHIV